MIVLAARPSMGKTALALNIGQKIAEIYNEHVVVSPLKCFIANLLSA
jgi:replicative DNA helicase